MAPYILGPTSSIQRETIHEALEPLSSPACNAHLVMLVFDAIFLTLFPELGLENFTPEPGQGAMGGSDDMGGTGEDNEDDGEGSMLPGTDDEASGSAIPRSDGVPLSVF